MDKIWQLLRSLANCLCFPLKLCMCLPNICFLQSFTFPCETLHLLAERLCFLLNFYVPQEALHLLWWRENYRFNVLAQECKVSWGNTILLMKECRSFANYCRSIEIFFIFFSITVFLVNSENCSLN